jgi:GT2 family glycosyltransferase/tetratricopeptide (TPR) repeat protein
MSSEDGFTGRSREVKRYYCTYFDRNYLLKGMALLDSLNRHEESEFILYAVCMDEITRTLLNKLSLPNVVTIPIYEVEKGNEALIAAKKSRSLVEYYWTTTPSIISYILENHDEIDILTYLDADLYFYSSPDPIFAELGGRSILIHEHRFSPSMTYLGETNGKYNVGLLSFRNDVSGITALRWWRERCLEWCYDRYEDGKMGDQMYLDDWPTRFENVVVLQHLGGGVGPWNHDQYRWSADALGRVFVNEQPLIFFHFHAFSMMSRELILPVKHPHYPLTLALLRLCYAPYIRAVSRAADAVQSTWKDFRFGVSEKVNLTPQHTFLAKRGLAAKLTQCGIPHIPIRLDEEWDCYSSEQVQDRDGAGAQQRRLGSEPWPGDPTPGGSILANPQPAAPSSKCPPGGPSPASVPRVSVIVSTYNSEGFIWEALEDLERQTIRAQMEIIVVDADSPQNERAIVEAFQCRYRNIVYIRTPARIGVYAAWNIALKVAKGDYVTPMSTNDRIDAGAYEVLVKTLDAHPDVALVYGDTYLTEIPHETFEQHTRCAIWQWPEYRYEDLLQNCLVGPHPMWRRAIHDAIGYFDESYIALGDQEFWLRMGETHQLLHIPVVTGLYWRSPEGLSNRLEIAQPEERRIREIYLERHKGQLQQAGDRELACSIIIPVFNKCELTQQCLTALAQVTNEVTWEVIIVDNASSDDTPTLLNSLSGDVQVIRNEENLGFAKACNQGAGAARGRHLVFLNNDTIPLHGWLKALVEEVEEHPEVAVVGSKLLYPDGTIQHAGAVFSRTFATPYHVYWRFPAEAPVVNRRREFQAVTAACMLVRREVFEAVGGFDEGYRNGFEDVDLCLKVRERGGRIVYQPNSVLYHLESQTPGRKDHDQENGRRLLERWGNRWLVDEDAVWVPDGYAVRAKRENGSIRCYVERLVDAEERSRWELVAEVERLTHLGDIAAIQPLLTQAEAWPEDIGVLHWAAQICERAGVPTSSNVFWHRLLNLEEVPEARLALARAALETGALDEAERHLKALLAQAPTGGEGWLLQGILAMQWRDYEGAITAFETALRHGGNARRARLGLGMAAMGQGRAERAWEQCAMVLTEDADDAEAIHWLLRAGTALERWDALAEQLGKFLRLNPGDLAIRFALAGVQIRLGHWEAASQEYDTIRLLNPTFEGLDDLAGALGQGMQVRTSVSEDSRRLTAVPAEAVWYSAG